MFLDGPLSNRHTHTSLTLKGQRSSQGQRRENAEIRRILQVQTAMFPFRGQVCLLCHALHCSSYVSAAYAATEALRFWLVCPDFSPVK